VDILDASSETEGICQFCLHGCIWLQFSLKCVWQLSSISTIVTRCSAIWVIYLHQLTLMADWTCM
jgi:hypothetical protein